LRVHRSNFQIVGFTERPQLSDLVRLARERGVYFIDDIGSGAIRSDLFRAAGDEPLAGDAITAGADVVLFSGDKLLGGPQCGIMAGRKTVIDRIESDPLMRALRLDKMTLAALEATLRLALDGDRSGARIPLWSMAAAPVEVLWQRATVLAKALSDWDGYHAQAVKSDSFLGGGSAPIEVIPSAAVAIAPPFPAPFDSESGLAKALRMGDPPVVARVQRGIVLLDLRAVPAAREADLLDALGKVCHDRRGAGPRNGPVAGGEGPV
jgi:L-seryl-tRNA(Ser) seleniumtransferase